MNSNKRKGIEEYQMKLDVYEQLVDRLHDTAGSYFGKPVYDIPKEELEQLDWSAKCDHLVYDEEGLQVYKAPVDEPADDWDRDRNKRYQFALEAEQVARKAIEKWLAQ